MSKLYIIGNGFDLAHGIESSYDDFFCYIADSSEYGQLSVMLEDFYGECGDLWSDFETTLGLIKAEVIHRFSEHEVNAVDWDEKELHLQEDLMEQTAEEIHNQLANAFTDWVCQINIKGVWDVYDLDKDAQFFTFNYTETLEQVYHIPAVNVLHIHLQNGNPIFGHGFAKYNEQWPKEGYESVFTDIARDRAEELFNEFIKPVPAILSRNKQFFNRLAGAITEIHVIGHSLSEVDLPYFSEIHQQCPKAIWNIYYYDPSGKQTQQTHLVDIRKKLLPSGIPAGLINAINGNSILL